MNSKCGYCGSYSWEIHTEEPRGSAYKINFIRCAMCKVPVGVIDYYDTHAKIDRTEKLVKALGDSVIGALSTIDSNIKKLLR